MKILKDECEIIPKGISLYIWRYGIKLHRRTEEQIKTFRIRFPAFFYTKENVSNYRYRNVGNEARDRLLAHWKNCG